MRQRIAQLEAEKTKLRNRMDEDLGESLKNHLTAVNQDLGIARERVVHYERTS